MSLPQLVCGRVTQVKPSVLYIKLVSSGVMFSDIMLRTVKSIFFSAAPPMLCNHWIYKTIRSGLVSYLPMHCTFLVLKSESDRISRWRRIWNLNAAVCHSPSAWVVIKETAAFPLD